MVRFHFLAPIPCGLGIHSERKPDTRSIGATHFMGSHVPRRRQTFAMSVRRVRFSSSPPFYAVKVVSRKGVNEIAAPFTFMGRHVLRKRWILAISVLGVRFPSRPPFWAQSIAGNAPRLQRGFLWVRLPLGPPITPMSLVAWPPSSPVGGGTLRR